MVNGKDEMAMIALDKLKGHFSGAIQAVFVAAGRTKLRMAPERNEFKFTTKRATIHGTPKGRIPAIGHLVDVFHNNLTGMKDIFNFFVFFSKDFFEDIYKIIMYQNVKKRKPLIPLMNEGLGS